MQIAGPKPGDFCMGTIPRLTGSIDLPQSGTVPPSAGGVGIAALTGGNSLRELQHAVRRSRGANARQIISSRLAGLSRQRHHQDLIRIAGVADVGVDVRIRQARMRLDAVDPRGLSASFAGRGGDGDRLFGMDLGHSSHTIPISNTVNEYLFTTDNYKSLLNEYFYQLALT